MNKIKCYIKINNHNRAANICFGISLSALFFLLFCAIQKVNSFFLSIPLVILFIILFSFDFDFIRKNITINKIMGACGLSFLLAKSFYHTIVRNYTAQALAGRLGIRADLLFLCAALVGATAAAYAFAYLLCIAKMQLDEAFLYLRDKLPALRSLGRAFIVLTGIYMLFAVPVIRANVNYIDDMSRKANGDAGWEDFSRYLSNIISKLLNANEYLTDISPLTQMIAVLLIAVASLIIIVVFTERDKISGWSIISVLPLGMSPYFLECISYKFDSPYMAISILAGVTPLLFYGYHAAFYVVCTIVCVLVTCTTYQAALGIFPVCVILLVFMKWKDHGDVRGLLRLAAHSAAGYLVGVAVYRIYFMTPVDSYVSSELFPIGRLPVGVVSNLKKYLTFVYQDFDKRWLFFIFLTTVSFVVLSVVSSKRDKRAVTVAAVLATAVTMCLSFGVYIAFRLPIFACRGMYGFGVWIAVIAVICTNYRASQIARASCLCLGWCFFVFSYTYGNALEEQQRYVAFRTEMIIADLDRLPEFSAGGSADVQITGTVGVSPIVKNMAQFDGVLHRLIVEDQWYWTTYQFSCYYGMKNMNVVPELEKTDLPVLLDGVYNRIRGDGDCFLIELKE